MVMPNNIEAAAAVSREVRTLREAAGLTRAQLAYKVGVCELSIYFWETGRHIPHPANYRRLIEVLGELPLDLRDTDLTDLVERVANRVMERIAASSQP